MRARPQALALQDDGTIVVAGFPVLVPSGFEQLVATRLLKDGTLDPDFGNGGVVAVPFGTRDARARLRLERGADGARLQSRRRGIAFASAPAGRAAPPSNPIPMPRRSRTP
ncbi:MAG: delta-60 repeat domain-containing protein [Thermodesulfobacteriota bacterium]